VRTAYWSYGSVPRTTRSGNQKGAPKRFGVPSEMGRHSQFPDVGSRRPAVPPTSSHLTKTKTHHEPGTSCRRTLARVHPWSCSVRECTHGIAPCASAPVVLLYAQVHPWSCSIRECTRGLAPCARAPVVLLHAAPCANASVVSLRV
jgi:hypothetical protein